MPHFDIGKVISTWWRDVFRLHDALFAGGGPSVAPGVEETAQAIPGADATVSRKKPRTIRPVMLLDHFGLAANVEPEAIVQFDVERWRRTTWPGEDIQYTAREFHDPVEAIRNQSPFVLTQPLKYLFLQGRNGAHCILTNNYPNPAPSVSTIAKLCGFDALHVVYEADPWHYFVGAYTMGEGERHIASSVRASEVNFFQTPTPMQLEDPEAIRKLAKGKPIGRGEIAKFCELFGWPLPMSREGLEFITGATMYEITPVRATRWAGEDEERAITLVPPGWLGEDVDLLASPPEDPVIAKREVLRRRWAKFRRAFRAEMKERFGTVRCVLVLPRDGVERYDDHIDVIAPDDGTLLEEYQDRAIDDALTQGSFFVEIEVLGIDEHRDVYVVLEMMGKLRSQKEEWRIEYAPGAEVPVQAYSGEAGQRELMDVRAMYGS
jgi:hypothetical protein